MSFERQEKIKELLDEKGVVFFKELEALFPQVTSMTLRRDIERLTGEGIAVKIRGGAKAVQHTDLREPIYSLRATKNIEIKLKIAKKALPYIETGRSVYLDAGSTLMCFASILPDISLNVLTSGPNIALEVLKNHNPTVNLIGGLINQDNLCVSGKQSLNFIKDVNIDIAFMSSSGFSAKDGFTCGNYSEAELKKTIIKKANRVIMLMDSNKVDKSLIFTFANIKNIDIIITDSALPQSIQSIILKTSTELIIV